MPVKHLISPGIGFSPGSVKFIVTRGLLAGAAVVEAPVEGGGDPRRPHRKKRRRELPTSEEVFKAEIHKLRQPDKPEVPEEPALLPTALPLEEIKDQVEHDIAFLIREDVLRKQQEATKVVAEAIRLERLEQERLEIAEGKRLAQEAIRLAEEARIAEEARKLKIRNNALIYLMIMALSDE